ncbi:hypothetical protein U1Q18_006764 [Sarracenia purpurea var. burkii]
MVWSLTWGGSCSLQEILHQSTQREFEPEVSVPGVVLLLNVQIAANLLLYGLVGVALSSAESDGYARAVGLCSCWWPPNRVAPCFVQVLLGVHSLVGSPKHGCNYHGNGGGRG